MEAVAICLLPAIGLLTQARRLGGISTLNQFAKFTISNQTDEVLVSILGGRAVRMNDGCVIRHHRDWALCRTLARLAPRYSLR